MMVTRPDPTPTKAPNRGLVALALTTLLLLAVLGLRFLQVRVDDLVALAEHNPSEAELGLLDLAQKAMAIPSAILAVVSLLMMRMAWRAWQTATFPPPGTWLLRETVPAQGAAAKRRAVAAAGVAMLTLILAFWLPREVVERLQSVVDQAREQRAPIEWNRPEP